MEILSSLSSWLSTSFDDLTVRENTPDAPTQSILSSILSSVDNAKRIVKRNVSDLFTDTDNALAKTSDNINTEILAKEKLQDPAQWLSGGAGKAASAFVGAFRPSNSKLLPSVLTRTKQELSATRFNYEPPALLGKLSDKELGKYGTTEFLLDKYLPSTQEGGNPEWLWARPLKVGDFLQTENMQSLSASAKYHRTVSDAGIPELTRKAEIEILRKANGIDSGGISLESDIRAFRDQITDEKPIFKVGRSGQVPQSGNDIAKALTRIDFLTQQSKLTPDQLSKKSLQQLLGIADSVEKAAQKSVEAITDFTKQRTAELKAKQGFKNDLVELTDKNDFGAETEFLQHCVGAGGADPVSRKFLPKWHPITGEEIIRNKGFSNSGEIYWGLKERGSARYFSYRPEGLPVATVELTKDGTIKQLYGKENSDPRPEDVRRIMDGLKPIIRQMKFGEGKKYLPTRADPDLNQQDYIMADVQRMLRNGRPGAVADAAMNQWFPIRN